MKREKWEYKRESYKETNSQSDLTDYLNIEGSQGWELVQVIIPATSFSVTAYFGLMFKRKII